MDTTVCAPEPAGHGRGILLHWLAAGMWRSLAAHLLWEQGVGGSNPPIPTSTWTLTCGYAGLMAFRLVA